MAVQCVELLQLPAVNQATIRKWAERGRVKRYGLDQYGLQKYELGDIIQLVSSGDQSGDAA